MPASVLFQSEVIADALDRVARRERLEAIADAVHKAAVRRARGAR